MKSYRTQFDELRALYVEEGKEQADYFIMRAIAFESFALIEKILDENDSLWNLIDEQKNSEIEQHAALLRAELDRKISEVFLFAKTKVIDA